MEEATFPADVVQVLLSRSRARTGTCMRGIPLSLLSVWPGYDTELLGHLFSSSLSLSPSSASPPSLYMNTIPVFSSSPLFLSNGKLDLWEDGDDASCWCSLVLMLSK